MVAQILMQRSMSSSIEEPYILPALYYTSDYKAHKILVTNLQIRRYNTFEHILRKYTIYRLWLRDGSL